MQGAGELASRFFICMSEPHLEIHSHSFPSPSLSPFHFLLPPSPGLSYVCIWRDGDRGRGLARGEKAPASQRA